MADQVVDNVVEIAISTVKDETNAVNNKEKYFEKTQAKEKMGCWLLVKQKRKDACTGSKKQQQPLKKLDSSERHIVVVVVDNIERDVAAAVSQCNVLVSVEESCCRSHGCHAACHVVVFH